MRKLEDIIKIVLKEILGEIAECIWLRIAPSGVMYLRIE
jgi:hypothetical protein